MKLSDFTMKQINIALDGQAEKLGEWKSGSRGCQIGVGECGGKKYQVKIHSSEPKWYNTAEKIRMKQAELAGAAEEDRERLQSELNSLQRSKADRDKRDEISDKFIDMRKKLVNTLNSIGTPLIVANADIWKEQVRGDATYAVEATPWLDLVAMGLTDDDNLPMLFSRDLSVDQQYKIVASLADVLSKIHAKGVVHGDLKIGNTLITKEGGDFKVALIDYDAAFVLDDLRRRKYPLDAWYYVIGGTYIAPELVEFVAIVQQTEKDMYDEFDMSVITEKSDIFSLGATIYEYFYGRVDGLGSSYLPYVGPGGEVLTDRVYGEAINFGYKLELPDTVPDFLYGMFNWMLAPDPAARPTAVQVRDAFASANANMIPSQFVRNPLWEAHRDRYNLTLPEGAVISKANNGRYRLRLSSTSPMVNRTIEDLVKEGYAVDSTGVISKGDGVKSNDPTLLTKFWPADGDGQLPTCVRRATLTGRYQMAMNGITKSFTYAQLCAEGVICSEADKHTPWPCDVGLKFRKSGIVRDLGLGKGPGHYKIGEGLAAIRRTTKELVKAGDAAYGVQIKLHPKDEEQYVSNPADVPTSVSNIFPDPMLVHRYVVIENGATTKMMIDELESKKYVKVR